MEQPEKMARRRFGGMILPQRMARFGWLAWFLALIVLGPVVWVVAYRFINPPVTLHMAIMAGKPVERIWVPLDKISPNLVDTVIASEDANFCTHDGFDRTAIREAWRSNQQGRKLRGASTISMQTARNVFLWKDRTWLRKGFEAYFTFLIELVWSKRRIMEVYLNVVEWGDGLYGAEAASHRYFRTSAVSLTSGQSARLAAVLPNPVKWSAVSDSPIVYYRALTAQERGDQIRVDGKSRCVSAWSKSSRAGK